MRLIQLALMAAVGYGAYDYWSGQRAPSSSAKQAASSSSDPIQVSTGFVNLPTPQGYSANSVIVFAPPDCPEAAGLRADEMMRRLAQAGIPVVRASSANFSGSNFTADTVAHINSVMAGELPAVFVRGTGKANPSVEETLAQYSLLTR